MLKTFSLSQIYGYVIYTTCSSFNFTFHLTLSYYAHVRISLGGELFILRDMVGLRLMFGGPLTGLNSPVVFLLLSVPGFCSLYSNSMLFVDVICLVHVVGVLFCLVYFFFFVWMHLLKKAFIILFYFCDSLSPVLYLFGYDTLAHPFNSLGF